MGFWEVFDELPAGWELRDRNADGGRARYAAPDGWVELAYYELLPGIVLSDIDLTCSDLPVSYPKSLLLATINWCASGRCEVDFGERGSMVVGAQSLCLSSSLANSFSYPTALYRGFECFVDFDQFDDAARTTLASFGLTEQALRDALVPHELGVTLLPNAQLLGAIHAVEEELAQASPRNGWLLMTIIRLFMLLASTDGGGPRTTSDYLQRSQRDMAQAVYQQIVAKSTYAADLSSLAARFSVSEASLRAYFARVYGESPTSFARGRVLAKASRLLAQTDDSVADIAQSCGYANPSKFSAAFRRTYGVNPLEYRRRSRLA